MITILRKQGNLEPRNERGEGWWRYRDLNSGHKDYDSSALTTELYRHIFRVFSEVLSLKIPASVKGLLSYHRDFTVARGFYPATAQNTASIIADSRLTTGNPILRGFQVDFCTVLARVKLCAGRLADRA